MSALARFALASFLLLLAHQGSKAEVLVAAEAGAKPASKSDAADSGNEKDADAAKPEEKPILAPTQSEREFLDRLMMAESGGNLFAKNPRSSALGPYQFLHSTFLDVVSRRMPELMQGKTNVEILQLRVDPKISRDAALIYSRENAAYLKDQGISPYPAYLRLAFLLGPEGALKVIFSNPETPVSSLLSPQVVYANPFLGTMTVLQLLERSEREVSGVRPFPIPAMAKGPTDGIIIRCNLGRASCRHWLALAKLRALRAATFKKLS